MTDDSDLATFKARLEELEQEKGYRSSPPIDIVDAVYRLTRFDNKNISLEVDKDGGYKLMVTNPRSANDVYHTIAVAGMVLGIFFIIGGVALVALGGTGDTTFTLFGNKFTSKNVGVACVFCGAIFLVLTIRRLIKGVSTTNQK